MSRSNKVHKWLTLFLQLMLLIGTILAIAQGRWLAAIATAGIIIATFLPLMLGRRFDVDILPESEVIAVIFVYASLFLGEVHGYYF